MQMAEEKMLMLININVTCIISSVIKCIHPPKMEIKLSKSIRI